MSSLRKIKKKQILSDGNVNQKKNHKEKEVYILALRSLEGSFI
jgi:hypothetical protein